MRDASERRRARRARLRERLALSRARLFALAHVLNGDPAESEAAAPAAQAVSFPHSHIMRALLGRPGRMLLGGAAVTVALLRPGLTLRAVRVTPMLRQLLMRYLLPRLLGEH